MIHFEKHIHFHLSTVSSLVPEREKLQRNLLLSNENDFELSFEVKCSATSEKRVNHVRKFNQIYTLNLYLEWSEEMVSMLQRNPSILFPVRKKHQSISFRISLCFPCLLQRTALA